VDSVGTVHQAGGKSPPDAFNAFASLLIGWAQPAVDLPLGCSHLTLSQAAALRAGSGVSLVMPLAVATLPAYCQLGMLSVTRLANPELPLQGSCPGLDQI
jgi:hypothetical protein